MRKRKLILIIALAFGLNMGSLVFHSCKSQETTNTEENTSTTITNPTARPRDSMMHDTMNYDGSHQPGGVLDKSDTLK